MPDLAGSQSPEKPDSYAVLRLPEFRLYVLTRFIITVAIQIQSVAVGWQIYQSTGDPLSLGLIGLTEAIPAISVALFAGYIADRYDRRRIAIITIVTLLICSASLCAFTFYANRVHFPVSTFPIYAIIFVTGLARGFLGPAFFGLFSQIVPEKLLANASAWNSTLWQSAVITGPALGGIIYGFNGAFASYIANTTLVFVATMLLLLISSKPVPERPTASSSRFDDLTAGIKFVFANQVLLGVMALDLFAVLFGGAEVLMPVFASDILKVGPEGLGLLRAAPAAGAILMAVWLTRYPITSRAGLIMLWAVAAFGGSIIVFALSTNFYLSLVMLFLGGAFDNISVIIRSTTLQLTTPPHMKGRVSAVNSIFVGSSNEIGAFESGVAAKFLGTVPAVALGGCMTLLVVAVTYWRAPKVRNLEMAGAR